MGVGVRTVGAGIGGLGCRDAPELRHSRCEEVQSRGRSAGLPPLGAELRLAAAAARRGGGVGACCGREVGACCCGGVELVHAQLARAELVSVRVRVRVTARASPSLRLALALTTLTSSGA